MVLFPSGQPATPQNRSHCAALLLKCGADLIRFLDGPWSSLDQLILYLVRLDEIVSGTIPPIVVLTQTNPLKLVVTQVRDRMCKDIVNLKLALWVIYVDPEEDPFFFANAARLGFFDPINGSNGRENPIMIWTPHGETPEISPEPYVVLTPQTADDRYLRDRIDGLWKDSLARSPEPVTSAKLRALLARHAKIPPSRRL